LGLGSGLVKEKPFFIAERNSDPILRCHGIPFTIEISSAKAYATA
jgi:hypothetical protein